MIPKKDRFEAFSGLAIILSTVIIVVCTVYSDRKVEKVDFPIYIEPIMYHIGPSKTLEDLLEEFENLPEPEPEPEPVLEYLGVFRLTGYCNCEICCGQWAGGPCYNGEMPVSNWTIAVDPNIIPINSYVMIDGIKYKACDTGSAIKEKRIDIYCDTHQECFSSTCNKYADVYLIK